MTKTDESIATSLVATDAGWISRQDSSDSSAPAEPQNMNCMSSHSVKESAQLCVLLFKIKCK